MISKINTTCQKQNKKVLLLTNKFPYGIGETFIEAELEALPDDIDLTIIPTQSHSTSDKGRTVPVNVRVDDIFNHRPKYEYPLKAFRMMFSKDSQNEVKERKKNGSVSIRERIRLIGYFGRAKQIADVIENMYSEDGIVVYSYWATEALFAEKLLGPKYKCISRAHGTDVYDGHCAYGTIPGQRLAIAGIDKIYVCSKYGRDFLQRKYPECRDKISYHYLGTKDYGWKNGENHNDEFAIVSCSRLVPGKRVHLLAKALGTINKQRIHWVHIGDGPERERVEEIIKTFPENIRATFLGNISHDDVMKYYCSHNVDLFINVSESEGIPVSIMEAISFGVPVIATDVGGTREIVTEQVGDLLSEAFKGDELVQLIHKYIKMDKQLYQLTREKVRHFWNENFSAKKNYKDFYNEITKD